MKGTASNMSRGTATKSMTARRRSAALQRFLIAPLAGLLLALIPGLLAGCGSGGSSNIPRMSRTGRATLVIVWPAATTRLIPDATQSIRVDVLNGTATVVTQVVNRQPGQAKATVNFPTLPVGDLTVIATAYPQPGAQGTPLAEGSTPLTITEGMNTTVTLTMTSTIDHIDLTTSTGTQSLVTNQVIQLTATARDTLGNMVLVAPGDLQYTSSNPNVAAVSPLLDQNGQPTGMASVKGGSAAGTSQITVTDFESSTVVARASLTVTNATPVGPTGTRFAYVANRTSGTLSVYTVNADSGAFTLSGTPIATGTNPQAVAVDPSGRFVYVANEGAGAPNLGSISAYTVDEVTGQLTPFPAISGAPYPAGTTPVALATVTTSTGQEFLLSADSVGGTVRVFSIDAGSGTLTPVGSPISSGGKNPVSIAVSPNGQFAYVVNAGDGVTPGSVQAFSISPSGVLAPIGSSVQAGVNAQSVAVTADGKYVYVANTRDNSISAFAADSMTGALTSVGVAGDSTAMGPYALTAVGGYLYVANRDSNNVSVFAINSANGTLTSAAPPSVTVGTSPEAITTDATGTYLYVTNLVSNNVSTFTINSSSGALSPIGGAGSGVVATGTGPSAIAATRGATGNISVTAQ